MIDASFVVVAGIAAILYITYAAIDAIITDEAEEKKKRKASIHAQGNIEEEKNK